MHLHYEICSPLGEPHNWLCAIGMAPPAADNLERERDLRVEFRIMQVGLEVTGLADDPRFEHLDENVTDHPIAFRLTQSKAREIIEWAAGTKGRWAIRPVFGSPMTSPPGTKIEFCFSDLAAATEAKLKFAAYLD